MLQHYGGGGVWGMDHMDSQMTGLPTWNRNPHTGPVYPITKELKSPCLFFGRSLNSGNQEVFQGDHWPWAK